MSDENNNAVRVIGCRWCPRTFTVTAMLSCNLVPYEFVPVESPEQAAEILGESRLEYDKLPVVIFEDVALFNPTEVELAEHIGLNTRPLKDYFDLVVVGAGPAGLSAAVYAASEGLNVTLIERQFVGGQAGLSARIENYLGFADGISGAELANRALEQARKFGADVVTPRNVCKMSFEDGYKIVELEDGSRIACRALLLAMGVSFRRLDAPGVDELAGRGVYYSAPMSEALKHADGEVFIVGGANSAGQAAVALAARCEKVTMVVRAAALEECMSRYLVDSIRATSNIAVRLESEVVEARGEEHLEALRIRDKRTGQDEWCPATVLYIYIGAEPHTGCLQGLLDLDRHGFIVTGKASTRGLETGVPGVFAAGDIRSGSAKRVATAVGEGCMAVAEVHGYLSV